MTITYTINDTTYPITGATTMSQPTPQPPAPTPQPTPPGPNDPAPPQADEEF